MASPVAQNWPPETVAPYRYTCLGHAQLTVSGVVELSQALDSRGNSVAVPSAAVMVLVAVETANVRWTDDGQTPTTGFGMPLAAGQEFAYSGDLNAIQFAAVSGSPILDLAYYK